MTFALEGHMSTSGATLPDTIVRAPEAEMAFDRLPTGVLRASTGRPAPNKRSPPWALGISQRQDPHYLILFDLAALPPGSALQIHEFAQLIEPRGQTVPNSLLPLEAPAFFFAPQGPPQTQPPNNLDAERNHGQIYMST